MASIFSNVTNQTNEPFLEHGMAFDTPKNDNSVDVSGWDMVYTAVGGNHITVGDSGDPKRKGLRPDTLDPSPRNIWTLLTKMLGL